MKNNNIRSEIMDKKVDNLSSLRESVKNLFDLSDNETTVFMHLLLNDKLSATEISSATGIQRTRTYEIFRQLKEKKLIELTSENPQRYSLISPRIAFDNWYLKSQERLESKKSMLMQVVPSIQKIWNNQHDSIITHRISLISEDLVKEIIPQEIRSAQKAIYLALKDPSSSRKTYGSHAGKLFDPYTFNTGIQGFLQRGVKLLILLGNIDVFLQNSHPALLKTLINGLLDGVIEVRAINTHLPQSFLLVDLDRLYLFFLDETPSGMGEALRTERESLISFFKMVWKNLWESAREIDLKKVVEESIGEKKSTARIPQS